MKRILNGCRDIAPTITSHYHKEGPRNFLKTLGGQKDGRDAMAVIEYEENSGSDENEERGGLV